MKEKSIFLLYLFIFDIIMHAHIYITLSSSRLSATLTPTPCFQIHGLYLIVGVCVPEYNLLSLYRISCVNLLLGLTIWY